MRIPCPKVGGQKIIYANPNEDELFLGLPVSLTTTQLPSKYTRVSYL